MIATILLILSLLTPWGEDGSYKSGHAEYPRPQLVRTNWTNLNGEWDYALETNTVAGLPVVRAQGKIRVPFCFESALSGVGIKVTPEDRMIYRRTVELHPKKGHRTLLNFEAVDYSTQVFVNGVEATDVPHEGGNLPFTVDITPFVREGANALEVKVWDPTEGQHGGRGKQALKPSGCYYARVSGIWQTVWLEEVPERYIRGYKVITDIGKGTVKFDFDLAGFGDVTVKVDGVLQSGESGESGEVVVRIPNAEPWSPENPKLYEFTAKYGEDEVKGYFAFRSVDKAADANGHMRFRLNGRPFYPLATLDQGWWPDGLLTPPCEEAMAFDLRTLKACGFNALRKHIKVEPRRYYYLCDKMGLAVIQDLPSGHEGMEQIDKACARRRYGFARAELKEMIDHLHNEPCIIMWTPYNEGWGQPVADLTRETLRWTRRYDPTRLVGGPSGWDDWEGGRHMKSCIEKWTGGFTTTPECLAADGVMSADTVDWHEYPGPALPVADRGRISFLGEFGGLGLRVPGHLWREDGAWGYGDTSKATDPKEMQQRYLKLMDEVRGLVGKGLAGSVYTQTTDVEIEINGLMTYDRKVLKYDAAALKAAHQKVLEEAADVASSRTVTCLSGSGWMCDGEAVSVPHTWNADDACDGPGDTVNTPAGRRGGDSVGGIGYLKKRAVYARQLPAKRAGRRYFLRFEGASVVADVKVNGRAVGSHVGAFTAFAFEVTDFLRPDGESELEVAVDNRWREDTQPQAADYSVYGGLYRNVWLVETDPVCIDPLTDGADGVKVTADPKTGDVTVEVSVLGGTNEVQRFHVEKPELWSPENPKLYTRRIEIVQKGSCDAVDVRFAFRTFEFRDGLFYLNGVLRKLRGVNRHQDRAGKGWAVSPEDEEEDIRLMKEMGADALRTAHYPQSRHVYDLCDELGLICWVEYPNVDRVTFSDVFERGMQRQVREMVEQLRNHPCVAMWSVFNELYMCAEWMRPHADDLNAMMERTRDLVHRLDPSRPVVGVMAETGDSALNGVPDELGLNVYPKWYSPRTMREMLDWLLDKSGRRTFAISEYGVGASVLQHGDPTVAVRANGMWHPEEYQAYRMHDNLLALMRESRVWGTYVWSMFDFGADNRREGDRHGINDKGIVTHDRRTKKDVFYLYQANWTKTPVLHLVGQRMTSVTNGTMTVMGFSNVGDVTLKVNGKTVGTQKPDEACGVCWREVRLKPGENRIELCSGTLSSSAMWHLWTANASRKTGLVLTVSAPKVDGVNWWPSRVFTNATERIQQALDSVWKAGGGTVRIAKGCYPIRGLRLRSNTTLYLESGAVLSASRQSCDFAVMAEGPSWNDAIIRIVGEKNVAVVGERGSVIDGNNGYNPKGEEDYRGVHGVTAMSVTNLILRGYTIQHTGNWAHRLSRVCNLLCENLTVLAGHDGINFHHCDRVRIRDCRIETGDDSIAGSDNCDVDIRNCRLSSACQIFRFAGRNVLIEDCVANGPCRYVFRGSLTPQAKRDGVWDPDLVTGRHSTAAFFCYMSVKGWAPRQTPGNIVIRNCRVRNCARLLRYNFTKEPWQEEAPLGCIRFENVEASGLWLPLAAFGGDSSKYAPAQLEMADCHLSFSKPVEAMIDGGNMRRIALKNVSVSGVSGVLFRSWDGDCELDCENVNGVLTEVVKGDGAYQCPAR